MKEIKQFQLNITESTKAVVFIIYCIIYPQLYLKRRTIEIEDSQFNNQIPKSLGSFVINFSILSIFVSGSVFNWFEPK